MLLGARRPCGSSAGVVIHGSALCGKHDGPLKIPQVVILRLIEKLERTSPWEVHGKKTISTQSEGRSYSQAVATVSVSRILSGDDYAEVAGVGYYGVGGQALLEGGYVGFVVGHNVLDGDDGLWVTPRSLQSPEKICEPHELGAFDAFCPWGVCASPGVVVTQGSSGNDDRGLVFGSTVARAETISSTLSLSISPLWSALGKCFLASLTSSSSVSHSMACDLQLFSLHSRLQISGAAPSPSKKLSKMICLCPVLALLGLGEVSSTRAVFGSLLAVAWLSSHWSLFCVLSAGCDVALTR